MTDPAETGPLRHELDFGGQVLLWSIRIWVIGVRHQRPALETIDKAYTLVGCPDGASSLNTVMQRLTLSARRVLDVRPPCFTSISADEQRLLDATRCYQRGDKVRPRFIVSAMSHRHAAPALLDALERLSLSLVGAGLTLQGDIASHANTDRGSDRGTETDAENTPRVLSLRG